MNLLPIIEFYIYPFSISENPSMPGFPEAFKILRIQLFIFGIVLFQQLRRIFDEIVQRFFGGNFAV